MATHLMRSKTISKGNDDVESVVLDMDSTESPVHGQHKGEMRGDEGGRCGTASQLPLTSTFVFTKPLFGPPLHTLARPLG